MEMKIYIGIDLGGTNTKFALVGAGGRILERRQFITSAYKNKNALLNAVADNINQLKKKGAQGVGIGAPGLVDSKNGIVHFLTNIAGFKNVNLKKELEKKTGLKVYADNDANLMALAEAKYGAAKGSKSVFCVTLGTGVGGGIVINGDVYRGNTQSAGEIGHVSIDANGPKCNCGGFGCVEAYVGNSYLVKRAEALLKVNSGITPLLLTKLARGGNKSAINLWRETAEHLGKGLVMIINVFDPEVIVIGGGMSGAGKFLFKPLREYVRKHALSVPAKEVKIFKAKLGNDAGVIGAAELAHKN